MLWDAGERVVGQDTKAISVQVSGGHGDFGLVPTEMLPFMWNLRIERVGRQDRKRVLALVCSCLAMGLELNSLPWPYLSSPYPRRD